MVNLNLTQNVAPTFSSLQNARTLILSGGGGIRRALYFPLAFNRLRNVLNPVSPIRLFFIRTDSSDFKNCDSYLTK